MTRILAAAVALFATAALAAGCGGGKDQDKPSGPTQQELKQSFIVRADRTCADFRRRATALAAIGTGPKAAARRISRTRRLSAQTLDELRSLNPPAADRRLLDRYFSSIEDTVRTVLPQMQAAVAAGDSAMVQQLTAVLRQRNAAQSKLARAYGFRVCGQREASQQAG